MDGVQNCLGHKPLGGMPVREFLSGKALPSAWTKPFHGLGLKKEKTV